MSELEKSIADYLADEFQVDPSGIDADTPIISSGLIDSFAMVELLLHIETVAGRKVDPGDVTLENLDTIGRIAGFIRELRAE